MLVRSVRPDEFDQCLDLLDRAFTYRRGFFKRYFYGDPWFKPEYTRVVEEEGSIVSIVQIVRREVRVGCATLTMGGIGNVGTLPEYRGRGYARAAMESALEVMISDGMNISMLFTGIHSFYERLGWTAVPLKHGVAKLQFRHPERVEGDGTGVRTSYSVRPYEENDADAVVDIYDRFNSCRSLTVLRTPHYWQRFAIDPEGEHFDIWVAEESPGPKDPMAATAGGHYNDLPLASQVVGYILGHRFKDAYGVPELCCLPGEEACFSLLVREVWKKAKSIRARELVYRLPEEPAITAALSEISIPAPPRPYHPMMLRVLNLRSIFEKILPELSRHSADLREEGDLTLITGFGEATLRCAPGSVALSEEPLDNRIELTQAQLFSLLFGLDEPPASPPLLPTLFPKQRAVYYLADAF